jgi:hypothetical protein
MNKERQRIKIAEACGWTDFNSAKHEGAIQYGRKPLSCLNSWEVPDYLNDLNAMHEAEKTLIFSKRQKYKIELQLVASNRIRNCMVCMNELIFATAAQRAEAFLRTLNLWEE